MPRRPPGPRSRPTPNGSRSRRTSHKDGVIVAKAESVYLWIRPITASPKAEKSDGKAPPRVFELRHLHRQPGKLADLNKRFREHTMEFFESRGMTNVGYWTPIDKEQGSENTLIYLLSFPSREDAAKSWKASVARLAESCQGQPTRRHPPRREGHVGLSRSDRLQPDEVISCFRQTLVAASPLPPGRVAEGRVRVCSSFTWTPNSPQPPLRGTFSPRRRKDRSEAYRDRHRRNTPGGRSIGPVGQPDPRPDLAARSMKKTGRSVFLSVRTSHRRISNSAGR